MKFSRTDTRRIVMALAVVAMFVATLGVGNVDAAASPVSITSDKNSATVMVDDFVIATLAAPTVIKEPEKPAEETAEGTEGAEGAEGAAEGEAKTAAEGDKKEGDKEKKDSDKKATEKKEAPKEKK